MRQRLAELVRRLRDEGMRVSVGEALDAHEAVAVAGFERERLREALASSLVKDEAWREAFDRAFGECFPRAPASEEGGGAASAAGAGEPRGSGGEGARGSGRRPPQDDPPAVRPQPGMPMAGEERESDEQGIGGDDAEEQDSSREGDSRPRGEARSHVAGAARSDLGAKLARHAHARRARLLTTSFRELRPEDRAEARALARELAMRLRRRFARRTRATRKGRLDLRRTLRHAAVSSGGVPLRLMWRSRRAGRPELVALLDLSWSTRLASELLLTLLAPCEEFFSRVTVLGFVDKAVPVSWEGGHLVPHAPLDFDAPSDLGRALAALIADPPRIGRATMLLVLGDARNNRKPARASDFAALGARAGLVAWIVPEDPSLWGRGDSDIDAYRRHVDLLLPAPDLRMLQGALARLARGRERHARAASASVGRASLA